MKKTHDYIHHYRGYWSDGGKCRLRIYQRDGSTPVIICSQLPDNHNTSVTNMAEYLAAEVIGVHGLTTPWCGWNTTPSTKERSESIRW